MSFQLKASANMDLCVDGEAVMALFQSLQQTSPLQNIDLNAVIQPSTEAQQMITDESLGAVLRAPKMGKPGTTTM